MTPSFSYISVIITPFKRAWPFIWTTLNSFYQRIICNKFDWFWPAGSEDFFKKNLLFPYYLPLENGYPLPLNKPESPLPKDNLYQVWLNLACWFWKRRFLKIISVFLLFRFYLPLEKGHLLPLNKRESPLPKDDLCQVWLKLVQ